MSNFKDTNFDSSKLKRGSILYSAKLSPAEEEKYALFNAVNIDWHGYKIYDQEFTYTGDVLSYIETQLDSKSSSSGVWDDIKDNEYITSQINIYASYTSNKIAPNIVWQNQIDNDTYSTLPSSSSSDAQGWYTSIDTIPGNNQYVWMSSIYIVKSLSNNILGYRGPSSTPIYLPSESGINGNFKSTIFCRTNETPKAPSQGAVYNTGVPTTPQVYKASDNEPITGVEWSDGIPSGQEILWASTGIIKDSSPETTVWTAPRQMTDTATYDVEFAKKQTNDATPATPTDSNRHGGSGTQIWFDPANDASEDFTQMYWRAERECINGEWGDWIIVRIKGEQGTAGLRGAFKSTVFKREESQPQTPGSSEGTYDNPIPSGWSDGIPSGTGPVWSTWKTFTASGNNGGWATPQLVADTPTYDVEFSPNEEKPNDPSTVPSVWIDPTTNHYKDHTEQNPHIYNGSWEAMIWRAERNRATTQDSWSNWVITKIKGEDGHVDLDVPYYEQRWKTFENITYVPSSWDDNNLPFNNNDYIDESDSNGWTLAPNYSSGTIIYMTSCKVIIDIVDNQQTKQYSGGWTTPIRITGIDGEANPIQPVLKYQWYNTNEYSNKPSCSTGSTNPGNNWLESPGNPSGENKYLWMIQGQRQNNSMQTIDGTNYWTSPICLSGADGEPGKDGDDIEFIYHIYSTVPSYDADNYNPNHWAVNSQDNYLGPEGYEWTNHPTGVTLSNKYEYCSYRRKTGATGNKQWTTFSEPFAWSIYGENGIDGDGVEYIYATSSENITPNVPQITSSNYTESQNSEWGVGQNINNVIWHDDPQQLNNTTQKFQWVSTRKYRYPKQNETTLGGNELDPNKKYWFDYSTPQLWNWYVNNGTNAPQVAMVYKRTNSGTTAPGVPNIVNNKVKASKIYSYSNASQGSWASSPGNSNDNYSYLWMTSIYYTSSETGTDGHDNELDLTYINYTVDNYTWQTPVCLTGEPGHDGEDGTDIEFIYFRTGDDNKTFNNGWDNFTGDSSLADWPFVGTQGTSYYIIDGVKTLSNQDHDTWTDNPFGVSTTYDYEYASIRKKVDGTWGDFCQPFLWSKYGEDGVDGDGVEYIYYCPATTTLIDWTNNNYNNVNPSLWDATTSEFQASEYYVSPWSDDPQIVGEDNKYEYVSQRKKRKITDSNKSNFDSSWTTGNSFTKNEQTYNVGDMVWFPYSIPALWANYAKDGLATNLVLETDNDSVTIGIDSNGLANNNYQDTTTFRLVYNTRPLTLSSDYTLSMSNPDNNLFDLSNNILSFKSSSDFSGTFAELSGDTLTITVPEGFDMNEYDNILPITFTATIINNNIDGLDYNTTAIFTLKITAVELTLNDIYKLNIDKLVVSPNPNNDGYETLNISLKSLTSTNSITTKNDADNNHLKVYYTPYRLKTGEDTSGQNNQVTNFSNYSLNYSYVKHKFELIYNNGSNDVLLDTETISAVFDGEQGNPGVDSKAQEYIYMLTSDIDFFENTSLNNYYKPQNWNNTNVDDYPFNENSPTTIGGISYVKSVNNISGNGIIDTINDLAIAYWTDNPQGVSDEYPYEWWSIRSYDTSNEVWESFSKPVIRANWGHSGEDGDGVEYIYYKNDSETFDGPDPNNWTSDEDFQSSEYINDEVNLSEYYGSYVNQYLTFKALGSGNITLTIPANVGISYVKSVSYRKNNGRWETTNNSSSDITITVPVVANDVVEWKGTATKYSNGITTDNYNDTTQNLSTYASNFDATCNYNIYGNIMSLLHGDNFVNKIELTTEFTFAGLFGTYNTSRTTLKNAENLVLPAIILTNGCYTYMFACNNGLKTCPKILPYRGIGLLHMYRSMFANCCKASELATELVEAPLILCKGSTNNNCWMYRMFGSAQYINKVELWIDYYYNPNTSSHKRYGFDYFLQNNTTNGTIIQHGSADLSVIYDYRDIPNNTQNEQDVSPSVQTPTYYPYNWTITKNAGTLVWTDNPSGVSETDKYEWVSVRKYKEVTEDDTELLTNFDVGQKAWHPYSEPKLWAKYGENGDPGQPGSSGLTIDFDNPSLQIAVNSNGLIKDNQEISTRIHVYSGETDVSSNITGVQITSITNNGKTHILTKAYNSNGGGYTLAKDNNIWKYTFKVLDNDVDNGADIDETEPWQQNTDYFINSNIELEFTITYNGNEYIKHITAIPIKYGEDGQDAELFELSSETSVIRYDAKSDNLDYEPSYVEYNIHHVRGNNDETQYINEIVSYTDINEYLNNGTLKLYYHLDTEGGIQQQEGGTIVVGDQTRPVPGTNSTTLFADTNTSLSGSGLYTTEGASLGGTKTDTTSTSQFVTDVNTIQADSVVVVPVREVELERNTAEETLLTYLDNSLNWSSMFNSYVGTNSQNTSSGSGSGSSGGLGGLTPIIEPTSKYDATNIASVAQALNDYADYLETASEQETSVRASFNVADIRNTADIVSNVASSLGEITTAKDGSQSWALSNEASIYVNDAVAQQDSEINTSIHSKVSAIEIQQKHDDLIQAQTIRDDLVQQGTKSEYYDNYASPEYTRIASATIDETWKLLTMSNNDEDITFKLDINNLIKNRQNWTPTSNGSVIINNNISGTVTLIRIRLVYDNSETLTVWDEDSLEIVYDGIDGVDSDVMEYIYYCPADTNQKSWNTTGGDNSENPANWTASNSPDYFPDGNTYIDNGTNGGWADHPHGVDSEHPYEYYSIRTKDGATGTWSQYETPVVWSHYGETGRDGDGVEYIYWRPSGTTIYTWDPEAISANPTLDDPRSWDTASNVVGKNGKKFQDNEYLGPTHSLWTDDPTGVTAGNSYEYVSQRKYNGSTKLWEQFSMPAVWTNYGQKGDKGDTGATAYVLDWTNDQINLAVDEVGYIIGGENGQLKETSININSLNGVFSNNPDITMQWSNGSNFDAAEMPWKRFTKNYESSMTTNNVKVYVESINYNTTQALNSSNIYCLQGDSSTSLRIIVGKNYPAANASDKAYIPPEGLELKVKVSISGNDKSTIQYKVLRICGQHIAQDGQDGQNAITYEIIPSTNAICRFNSSCIPNQISYVVNKYNGTSVSKVLDTEFSNSFCAKWEIRGPRNSATIGSSILDIATSSTIGVNDISYINLELMSNDIVIDRETIPIVDKGENGSQGFTGPIVRMRGQYVHNSNTYYGNGEYNRNTSNGAQYQYDGTSPLYVDIVTYTNNNGTKYYTPKVTIGTTTASYINTSMTNSYLCTGSYFVSNMYPTKPNGSLNGKWKVATQYDFIATKLLYADQALINQISSHDFIATTQDGTPVAGMTSGKKDYGSGNTSLSLLNNANNGNVDTGGITGSASDTLTDTSHVRIFAGQIWKEKTINNETVTSYSLTYAPFNVRQDGTAYMSKANIIGDVNIGGNVNISGNNVNMAGHLSANTLSLGTKSFYYNEDVDLPAFNTDQHRVIYAMFYSTQSFEIIPKSDSYLWLVRDDSENNGFYSTSHAGDSIQITDKALYTLYSGYGNNPIVSGNPAQKFWIITKNNLFVTHIETSGSVTEYVPASISIDITDYIEIYSVEFQKTCSSGNVWNSQVAFVTFGFLKGQNAMPEYEEREYIINDRPTSFRFDKKEYVNITLNLSENWTLVSRDDIHQWGNVSQRGDTLLWNENNINYVDATNNRYKYTSKIPQNATNNIEGYPSFYIDMGTIEPEGGLCLEFYRNGIANNDIGGENDFKDDLQIVSASLRLSRSN